MPATVEREVVPAPASVQGPAEVERLNEYAAVARLTERLPLDAPPAQIAAFRERIKAQI